MLVTWLIRTRLKNCKRNYAQIRSEQKQSYFKVEFLRAYLNIWSKLSRKPERLDKTKEERGESVHNTSARRHHISPRRVAFSHLHHIISVLAPVQAVEYFGRRDLRKATANTGISVAWLIGSVTLFKTVERRGPMYRTQYLP